MYITKKANFENVFKVVNHNNDNYGQHISELNVPIIYFIQ